MMRVAKTLTSHERKVLALFVLRGSTFTRADAVATEIGTSPQGLHQTAASLVRKGMLERSVVRGIGPRGDRNRFVAYRATSAGKTESATHRPPGGTPGPVALRKFFEI